MNLAIYRRLRELSEASGKEYGKLVQKLLAIAFLEAGADSVTDRSTQGIDLEVTWNGVPCAFEVKTTEGTMFRLQQKDLDGLAAKEMLDVRPFLAVLGGRLLDDWIFARFHDGELQPSQEYSVTQVRTYRDSEIEQVVAETFPAAVLSHTSVACSKGQRALDVILNEHKNYRLA